MKEVKKLKFSELSLSKEMQSAIADMGFIEASPIQSQTIPHLLERKDVIGQAQTGTGKTAAFGIPLLELIKPEDKFVSSMIVCPTRELAIQVGVELKKLSKYKKHIHVLPIYGGSSMQNQIQDLKRGVNVVVGTPGRIMDHLDRKTLSVEKVKMVVLDEADIMLDMGFRDDIESLLKKMPATRQTVLFSATMAKPILDIAHKFQNHPVNVKVTTENLTNASIQQQYFEVGHGSRAKIISTLMHVNDFKLALTFCNTKRKVDEVVSQLKVLGHKADGIHGDLSQNQRNAVLAGFKEGRINILVASDVAARGIDVSNVDAVFNYDIPMDAEYYVHRIGRTGRAGKSGKAYSFITGRNDFYRLRDIERFAKTKIEKGSIPNEKEVADIKNAKLLTSLQHLANEGNLERFDAMVHDFCKQGFSPAQLAAVLLKNLLKDSIRAAEESKKQEFRSGSFNGEGGHPRRERSFSSGRNRERRSSSSFRRHKH